MRLLLLLLLFPLLSSSQVKIVRVPGTIFDIDTYVIVTKDTVQARLAVNAILPISTEGVFVNRAVTFYSPGYPIVTWFPSTPLTVEGLSIINHEILHIVVSILSWAGVPLTDESEEVYCYMLQYYTKEIYKRL